jgi:hypothetical protein
MAKITNQGTIYTTADLKQFARTGSMGQFSEAVFGVLVYVEKLEKRNKELEALLTEAKKKLEAQKA